MISQWRFFAALMTHHVLNGDSLAFSFPAAGIPGNLIVFREALMTGDLSGNDLPAFWKARATYLKCGPSQYQSMVLDELEQITASVPGDEFNLWFEYDLFCQVNLWFILSMLYLLPHDKKIYAVYTSHISKGAPHFWNGFGPATAEQLRECFRSRILLQPADLALGNALWQAFRTGDTGALVQLSQTPNPAFPFIEPVIQAHADSDRPARTIESILNNGPANFEYVFSEFYKSESIYGFGDSQLKTIYDEVMAKRKK